MGGGIANTTNEATAQMNLSIRFAIMQSNCEAMENTKLGKGMSCMIGANYTSLHHLPYSREMNHFHRPPGHVLATDLDGTLIPLQLHEQNLRDLQTLREHVFADEITLVFVTGRHLASVQTAITEFALPQPKWIICDVGTTICQLADDRKFISSQAYEDHLSQIVGQVSVDQLYESLSSIAGMRRQEPEKQGRFKLSYYADAAALDELCRQINQLLGDDVPYSVIHSVDPFNGDGLIDLLPRGVSKAFALEWWSHFVGIATDQLVFAGDSGNDLAALVAGYRTILVGNADDTLRDCVRSTHEQAGWANRLFLAEAAATSGVLAGCRHFKVLSGEPNKR